MYVFEIHAEKVYGMTNIHEHAVPKSIHLDKYTSNVTVRNITVGIMLF